MSRGYRLVVLHLQARGRIATLRAIGRRRGLGAHRRSIIRYPTLRQVKG